MARSAGVSAVAAAAATALRRMPLHLRRRLRAAAGSIATAVTTADDGDVARIDELLQLRMIHGAVGDLSGLSRRQVELLPAGQRNAQRRTRLVRDLLHGSSYPTRTGSVCQPRLTALRARCPRSTRMACGPRRSRIV